MNDLFSLAGRNALVTGASSGLGRHFARVLAEAGAAVALAARREDRLVDLAEEIEAAGGRAAVVALDVTAEESVLNGFAEAEEALGPIHVLINNAGTTARKPALELSEDEWDAVMDTNLKGAFLVAREFARRRVAEGGGGAIVNTASILSLRVSGALAPYCASKAGLAHLTRALALEWARHGIRVNALAPGYFVTDLNRDFLASETGDAIKKRIPQRRFGEADDLNGALLLLASDASRYMTGVVLPVDGGHLVGAI